MGNPIRYMIVISRGVFLRGLAWDLAAVQIWPMAIIGIVGRTLATWLFRRRLA